MENIKYYDSSLFFNEYDDDGKELGRYIADVYVIDLDKFYSSDESEIKAYILNDLKGIAKASFENIKYSNHFINEVSKIRADELR